MDNSTTRAVDIEKDEANKSSQDCGPKKRIYMDDALALTKYGAVNYLMLFVAALAMAALFLDTCGVSLVLPVFGCDFNITAQQKGLLGGIGLFGVICSSHLWGFLADTYGRKRIIQPTLLAAVVASVASTFVGNFYLLVFLRFLNGVFISGSSATIFAYLGEFHDSSHRSRAVMIACVIDTIICLPLPFVGLFVINQDWQLMIPVIDVLYKPWRLFFIICSLPGLIAWVCLFFLPESPKFVLGQGDQAGAIAIVKEIHRRNNGKGAVLDITEIHEEPESIENRQRLMECQQSQFPFLKSLWIQTVPLFKPPYLKSTIITTTVQFCVYYVGNGVYIFFSEILNRMMNNVDNFYDDRLTMCDAINLHSLNASTVDVLPPDEDVCVAKLETETAELAFVLEIMCVVGMFSIGVIIAYVKKTNLIFVVVLVTSLSAIAAMQVTMPIVQIIFFFVFLCIALIGNVLSALMIELYPTALRGMAVNILMMTGRFGGVVGANVTSILLYNHCEYAFYVPGCLIAAVAFLVFLIPYNEKLSERNDVPSSRTSVLSRHSLSTTQ